MTEAQQQPQKQPKAEGVAKEQETTAARVSPSVMDVSLNVVSMFAYGVARGVSIVQPAKLIARSPTIREMVLRCVFLNGVLFLGSMVLFDFLIMPLTRAVFRINPTSQSSVPTSVVSIVYQVFWLYPVYIFTFVLSSSLHSKIAAEAVKLTHTGVKSQQATIAGSLSDSTYKTFLYCSCVLQTLILYIIPYGGRVASFMLSSLLYAFLCIDVKWSLQKPWRLQRRLDEFQSRWAFFLGFGAPFTLTCSYFPLLVNCGIYAILFPIFELMSLDANEVDMKSPPVKVFKPAERFNDFVGKLVSRLFSAKKAA